MNEFDPTLVSAVLEADKSMTTTGELVLQRYDDDELDGNWPCFTRLGTEDSTKAIAHYVFDNDAEAALLFRTAAPLLARRVMELEADRATYDEAVSMLESVDDPKYREAMLYDTLIERDELKGRVAELEAENVELRDTTIVVECSDPDHQERDQLRERVVELEALIAEVEEGWRRIRRPASDLAASAYLHLDRILGDE